jgi:oligosaccharide repeat unit polymerase
LVAVVQALVLYSIRTTTSKRKIYIRAGVVVLLALAAMDVVGENRTAQEGFFEFLEIKQEFRTWPVAVLWPISYMSIPISNMCWIVKGAHFNEPNISFLYPVLPSFWEPESPHAATLSDSHLIDGVHTYLASYYLDFSWAGIVACNFALGLIAGFLRYRERISRQFLMSPVILSAFSFIFFWDFFVSLPTIIQLCIQAMIGKRCILPVNTREALKY